MSLVVLVPTTPAAATHVNCGIISEDTTLTEDVLDCAGYGLIIRTDNITLDLDGHTVSCNNTFPEQVGILLDDVSGVTVENGTVEGCDAGISIEGGDGNTVRRMIARDNVNDMEEPFPPTTAPVPPATLADILCDYGDGILTFNSSNNVIERNWVHGNGPYSGISLVEEGSDGNIVRNNRVENNDLLNYRPGTEVVDPETGAVTGQTSLCGATLPGTPGMQRGRNNQNIGIRIEGPGADNNHIQRNQVTESGLAGISVHSHVCNPQPGDPRGNTDPNVNNRIDRNVVTGTGTDTFATDPVAEGIGLLAQGPIGNVTCGSNDNIVMHNRSNNNLGNGILVNADNADNTIQRNQANGNGLDGIRVAGGAFPATGNLIQDNRASGNGLLTARFDAADLNFTPTCDANRWINNQFGNINQDCVGGGGTVPPPAPAPAAASSSESAAADTEVSANRGPRSS